MFLCLFACRVSLFAPEMEEQLKALTEQVQKLQADNDRLRAMTRASMSTDPVEGAGCGTPPERVDVHARYIYFPGERKCPKFTGKSSDALSVEKWVEEIRRSLRYRCMSLDEQALFIYDHLEGEARTEIKFHSLSDRNDPERILTILTDMYGCSQSYIGLQKQFYHKHYKQAEGESLREYSHSLLSLMDAIKRQSPQPSLNSDQLLRDQFVEYVRDGMLQRELK